MKNINSQWLRDYFNQKVDRVWLLTQLPQVTIGLVLLVVCAMVLLYDAQNKYQTNQSATATHVYFETHQAVLADQVTATAIARQQLTPPAP